MIYYSSSLVQNLFQTLEYSPKRWLKNHLNSQERELLAERENNRQRLLQRKWQIPFQAKLEKTLPKILGEASLAYPAPTLKAPGFFADILNQDLRAALLELSPLKWQAEVQGILNRAQLQESGREFFAVPSPKGLIVCGNSFATKGNLICLAHEVGHALYEMEHPGDELGSECFAFVFEDEIANRLLVSMEDRQAWEVFKSQQDTLNYFLCLNEFHEFRHGISKTPKNVLFFRESLLTCWGYQSINALASLYRRACILQSGLAPRTPSTRAIRARVPTLLGNEIEKLF